MKLRQAESFGVFDNHYRSVGNINTNFNYCRRHEYLNLIGEKPPHYFVLFGRLHFPMDKSNRELWENRIAQILVPARGIFEVHLLRFFDKRIDDINLPARLYLPG